MGRTCAGEETHSVGRGVETAVRSMSFGVGCR